MKDFSLKRALKQGEIPSASIAIIRKEEGIITQAAGIADIKTAEKVSSDLPFEAASLTKPFFAYIVLKMIEQRLFSRAGQSPESGLDRPLTEITSEFGPPPLRKHPYQRLLTVRRILSHQSGLPNWFKPDEKENYKSKPGVGFDYSGLAFCSLNDVLAQNLTPVLQKHFSLFKKLEKNYLNDHRHDDPKLREEYNKRFGIVLKNQDTELLLK